MAGHGPAPLPTALKVLRGAKRVNRREPSPAPGEPAMPADLDATEAACWCGLVAELRVVPGLLTVADRGVLELAARLEPMFREAARHVRKHGSTLVVRDDRGAVKFTQQTPQMGTVIKVGAQLKTIYAELGLTPAGRTRVSVTPARPASKLQAFLGGKHGA